MKRLPTLIPCKARISIEEIEALHTGEIIACDFYISGIERHEAVTAGYRRGRILNLDHHAPTEEMRRHVSSTNLAIDWVRVVGPAARETMVVINHTDCDSILSSAIIAGLLEPLDEYGSAAIAADHTGVPDPIADVLQGLDKKRDIELSFDSVARLTAGLPLEGVAKQALEQRTQKRELAKNAVDSGLVRLYGPVAFGELSEAVDGEFFPALLPGAALIVLMSRRADNPEHWNTKIRLGNAAPLGASIQSMRIQEVDPAFDGRWNAGSNSRAGGTAIPPAEYRERILALFRQQGASS